MTLIANYLPLQDAYGGPNYFSLDTEARYEIHIDNSGDGKADVTFRFQFDNVLQDVRIPVGDQSVSVALLDIGPQPDTGTLYVVETFTVSKVGSRSLRVAATGDSRFIKPTDNVGTKSFPAYAAYANRFLYDVEIPGCGNGRLFVGQRRESFVVNLGEVFDLVNLNPVGGDRSQSDDLDDKNITSFILEAPISCLTEGNGDVIGGWTPRCRAGGTSRRARPSTGRKRSPAASSRSPASACPWSTRWSSVSKTRTSSTRASPRTTFSSPPT